MEIEGSGAQGGLSSSDQPTFAGGSEQSAQTDLDQGFGATTEIETDVRASDEIPVEPEAVATPETVVREIWDTPAPSYTRISGIPEQASVHVYEQAVISFNAERAQLADAAIEAFAPTPEMFEALPPAMAAAEYNIAMADYQSDVYVAELGRLRDEALATPDALPGDPFNVDPSGVHIAQMPLDQVRNAVGNLGIELPATATGADVMAARELLEALPADVLAAVLSPGVEVNFSTRPLGISTPGLVPVRAQTGAVVQGEAGLSEVRTGAGFNDTQQLSLEVEVRSQSGLTTRRTTLQTAYAVYDRLSGMGLLSDSAQRLVQSSPLASALVRSAPVRGSIETFQGTRISYEATVTPEQGALIAAGELATPNPFDPLSMPQGTSVMIRGQDLTGSSFDVAYRGAVASGHVIDLEGTGYGVTRLEGDVVQVVSGPVEAIENSSFLGIGINGLSAGVGVSRSLEDQTLQIAQIDLSTASGRQAYQSFLSTGQIPPADGLGVPRSGELTALTYTHSASGELNLGPLDGQFEFSSSNVMRERVEYSDGTVTYDQTVRINGTTLDFDFTTDANGEVIEESTTYTIVYTGTSATPAANAVGAFGLDSIPAFEGQHDLQLSFTHEQLDQLRGLARAEVEARHPNQPAEMIDQIVAAPSGFIEKLAGTPDPAAAARLFLNTPGGFFETDLLGLAASQEMSLPGSIATRPSAD